MAAVDLAGDQAELGGKHAHCVPEPNETERIAEIWESWPTHSSWSFRLVTATISWWEGGRDGIQGNSSCMEMPELFRKKE